MAKMQYKVTLMSRFGEQSWLHGSVYSATARVTALLMIHFGAEIEEILTDSQYEFVVKAP